MNASHPGCTVPRRRPWRLALLAAALGLPATVVSGQLTAGTASAADDGLVSILVLGDSYSAGNGAGDIPGKAGDVGYYGSEDCWRSAYNYGRQFQRIIEAPPYNQRAFVENRACNGAVTADFFSPQADRGADVVAQQEWVDEGYDLIFLTFGGNDIGFADIVRKCLVQASRDGVDCNSLLGDAENLVSNGTLASNLRKVLTGIRDRAHPNAKIVLLGYPYLEGDPNYRLRTGHFADTFIQAGARIRALTDQGNTVQQQLVDELNAQPGNDGKPFVFVKVSDAFAGHELFAQKLNSDRWFVQPWEDCAYAWRAWWYHPNRYGHFAEAQILAADPRIPKQDLNGSGAPTEEAHLLDIVLVIDTTGSMDDDIAAVQASSLALLERVSSSGADWRMGLVTYRDHPVSPYGETGDYPSRVDLEFTSNAAAIRSAINGIVVSGGGDEPEAVLSAMMTAIGFPWRDGAKKAIVVLGDAPPHDPEPVTGLTATTVITAALDVDPAEIYPVLVAADSGVREPFGDLADGTGGEVVDADGASGVASALGEVLENVARAPIANAGGPYSAAPGEEIYFSASGSYDSDGTIVRYEWDVDNDGVFDAQSREPTYTATFDGSYSGLVSLRVTDDSGLQTVGQAPLHIAPGTATSEAAPPDIAGVIDAPPVALADSFTSDEDAVASFDVLANDTDDVPLDRSTITVTANGEGTPDVVDGGTIRYVPAPDWNGTDRFSYELCDESAQCVTAEVTVTVRAINDPPECSDLTATGQVGHPIQLAPTCHDVDGDTLRFEFRSVPDGADGSIDGSGAMSVTFSKAGNAVVEFVAIDASGAASTTARATVQITSSGGSSALTLVIGIALVLIGGGFGGALVMMLRRRRTPAAGS